MLWKIKSEHEFTTEVIVCKVWRSGSDLSEAHSTSQKSDSIVWFPDTNVIELIQLALVCGTFEFVGNLATLAFHPLSRQCHEHFFKYREGKYSDSFKCFFLWKFKPLQRRSGPLIRSKPNQTTVIINQNKTVPAQTKPLPCWTSAVIQDRSKVSFLKSCFICDPYLQKKSVKVIRETRNRKSFKISCGCVKWMLVLVSGILGYKNIFYTFKILN